MMQKNIRLAKRFVFNNHNVLITKKVETCQLFPWSGFWRGWWPVLGLWLRLWLVLLLTLCSEGFCSASKCLLEWYQIDVNQTFLATVLWSMLEKAAGHYNQIIEQTKEQDLSACCTCRSTPCPAADCRSCLRLAFGGKVGVVLLRGRGLSATNWNNIFWAEELKDVQHLAASNARSCREVKEAWNFLPPMRQLECAS